MTTTVLDPDQRRAVEVALAQPVSVITGGPGSGKTRAMVELAQECRNQGRPILLAASTARAAQQTRIQAEAAGLELAEPPGTYHRLLGLMSRRRPELPAGPGILVVDEASMTDLVSCAAVLEALPRNWSVVLVGDVNQLPPVEAGQPFADLVSSLPPEAVVHLRGNHRVDSPDLGEAIAGVLAGQVPPASEHFRRPELTADDVKTPEQLAVLLARLRDDLAREHKVDRYEDVLLLSPKSNGQKSPVTATESLNPELRRLSNPAAEGLSWRQLAVDDRVVVIQNDYRVGVVNGETGVVTDCATVSPERVVEVEFPDRAVRFEGEDIDRLLRLAYAVTVHKGQGGQAAVVILVLAQADRYMCTRRLVYTGISRARRTCVVLAQPGCLEAAVANRREERRWGLLGPRLTGAL